METSLLWSEYFSVLDTLGEALQTPEQRKNSLEKECRVLSLFVRLEHLVETLVRAHKKEEGHPETDKDTPPHLHVSPKQLSRHLEISKTIADMLLRNPNHPNALPLLCFLSSPQ
ncbi:hypothetical protein NECID01_0922 [Nematocida sp. AWRm77]|nr:hypothetical protein NECID01_0922 [Nematocida sp. AWRm77]